MRSKVLIVYERMMPTVSVMKGEMEQMYLSEGIDVSFVSASQVSNENLNSATAVMLIRPENILSYKLAKCAKKRGSYVVGYCDDDLLNLPKGSETIPWRKSILRKTLRMADEFESPSEYLCEKYSKLTTTGNYCVGHSTIRDIAFANIPLEEHKGEVVKLVYAAGRDHVTMFNQYIMPILPELSKKFKDRISLTLVGVHPDIDECNKYIPTEFVGGMPLEEYREFMRNSQFDIGLAPLSDTPFHRCKYFNKFIEYTLVGVTGIYSNNPPYTYVIKDEQNGLLADDSTESWLNKLTMCIENANYRKKSLHNAIQYLRDNHSEAVMINRFRQNRAMLYKERDVKQLKSPLALYRLEYKLQRIADLSYMTVFTLKSKGLKQTLEKMKSHNREIKKMAE